MNAPLLDARCNGPQWRSAARLLTASDLARSTLLGLRISERTGSIALCNKPSGAAGYPRQYLFCALQQAGRQCGVLCHLRCPIVIADRFRRGTRQSQCAVDGIADGYNKTMPRGVLQPWLDRCGKAASEGQTISPKGDEPMSECIDVPAGEPQELNGHRVIG